MLLDGVALIKFYGRKDHLMGPLLNATYGGEGVSNPSEEVRAKQRASAFRRNGGERILILKIMKQEKFLLGICRILLTILEKTTSR